MNGNNNYLRRATQSDTFDSIGIKLFGILLMGAINSSFEYNYTNPVDSVFFFAYFDWLLNLGIVQSFVQSKFLQPPSQNPVY